MKYFKLILCVVFTLGIFVFQAEAGILMTSSQESYAQPEDNFISKAYVDKNRMRVETTQENTDHTMIFSRDRDSLWVINNKEKTYIEITKKNIQQLKNRMDEAMMKLEEQIKDMPPEQRAMIEKMMKGRMPVTPQKTVYKKTGSNIKVNQWICDKYEGYMDNVKTKEIWTTDTKKLGLNEKDLEVMQGLSEFFMELTKNRSTFYKVGSKEWEKELGYSGIPVKTVDYSNGIKKTKVELKEVKKQDFSSSLFELPEGFTKKEYPGSIELD